jgi:ribonuclease I
MGLDEEDIKSDKKIKKELSTPDPQEEKIKELAIEKAELENAEIRAQIDVLNSEENKNNSKVEYDKEFLRQRRIALAEDIKEKRKVNREKHEGDRVNARSRKSEEGGKTSKTAKAKPVKILNK